MVRPGGRGAGSTPADMAGVVMPVDMDEARVQATVLHTTNLRNASLERERETLKQRLAAKEDYAKQLENQVAEQRQSIEERDALLEAASRDKSALEQEHAQVCVRADGLATQLAEERSQLSRARREVGDLDASLKAYADQNAALRQQLELFGTQAETMTEKLQEVEVIRQQACDWQNHANELAQRLHAAEADNLVVVEEREGLRSELANATQKLRLADESNARLAEVNRMYSDKCADMERKVAAYEDMLKGANIKIHRKEARIREINELAPLHVPNHQGLPGTCPSTARSTGSNPASPPGAGSSPSHLSYRSHSPMLSPVYQHQQSGVAMAAALRTPSPLREHGEMGSVPSGSAGGPGRSGMSREGSLTDSRPQPARLVDPSRPQGNPLMTGGAFPTKLKRIGSGAVSSGPLSPPSPGLRRMGSVDVPYPPAMAPLGSARGRSRSEDTCMATPMPIFPPMTARVYPD
eukprot:jgi/Mesvir1/1570/Mv14543-RA.1